MTTNYIAIDWGSTHLRAWRYQHGVCTDSRQQEAGITRLAGRHPRDILTSITEGWERQVPIIMAGMVGSAQGWCNVPYLPCPLRLTDIASMLTRIEENVWIVPGVSVAGDRCNIMRGEETQLLGAWQQVPASLYVMPGTHCKWARVEEGCLQRFSTVMTGELHHLLLKHSLIGQDLPLQITDQQIFIDALNQTLHGGDLLPRLFEVRAAYILGQQAREAVSEQLSGLLIGAEIAQMRRLYGQLEAHRVSIVASPQLGARYLTALNFLGVNADLLAGDVAFQQGIRSIVNDLGN